jgi:hypothetical protein
MPDGNPNKHNSLYPFMNHVVLLDSDTSSHKEFGAENQPSANSDTTTSPAFPGHEISLFVISTAKMESFPGYPDGLPAGGCFASAVPIRSGLLRKALLKTKLEFLLVKCLLSGYRGGREMGTPRSGNFEAPKKTVLSSMHV